MVTKSKYSQKNKDLLNLFSILISLILLNFIAFYLFTRFDLTSEKRYTIAPVTKKILNELDDVLYVKVYLQGDFPPQFAKLKNETKEMLDEFRAYSNNNLAYEFINPLENPNKEEVNKLQEQLYKKGAGIIPEQIVDKSNQKKLEILLWPGAICTYKGKEVIWQIFKRQIGFNQAVNVHNSIQELEYNLLNTIKKLIRNKKQEVLFLEGHGELDTIHGVDFMTSVREYYNIATINIKQKLHALKGADALVISKPDSMFNEKDKYIIDNFIMYGGKVLWLIDPVFTSRDTMAKRGFTLAFKNDLNIDDMLFKYGVRLNPVLIQDLQCGQIPINIGFKNNQPDFKMFPWTFNPLILPTVNHPIVKNIDLIKTEFLSTIDTIATEKIKKTILLTTSKYTKIQQTPARVSLESVRFKPNEKQFKQSYQPIACLLEGVFESVYKNRISPTFMSDPKFGYKETSVATKMIVVSDGDIARNEIQKSSGMIYPVGFDRFTQTQFANKTFLLNCLNYLLDDEGLLQLRSREVKMRLLDSKKCVTQKLKWKWINVGMPLLILLFFAYVQWHIKKRQYSSL